ncbi:MAG TPA: hypothetical protein VFU76_12095 [Terriglobales bacterium]|nr:hypothetical protein [Terriglobales bacterium]
MARGWESKSVEEQQSTALNTSKAPAGQLTPEQRQRLTEKKNLELARTRVMTQMQSSQNPRYQELLKAELEALNQRLAAMGG